MCLGVLYRLLFDKLRFSVFMIFFIVFLIFSCFCLLERLLFVIGVFKFFFFNVVFICCVDLEMEGFSVLCMIIVFFVNINLFCNYFFFDFICLIKCKDLLGIKMILF